MATNAWARVRSARGGDLRALGTTATLVVAGTIAACVATLGSRQSDFVGAAAAPDYRPDPQLHFARSTVRPGDGDAAVVVRNRKATATIVIGPDAGRFESGIHEKHAAQLLQQWIGLMTGAQLPIAEAPGAGMQIYIGSRAADAGLELGDVSSRSNDAVRVVVEPDRVLIGAQSPQALSRAVAILLEELGCRWFMEGDLGRVHPDLETLAIEPMTITDRPGFAHRRIWGSGGWADSTPWKRWNGAGGVPMVASHSWREITEDDFDEHPDWFAMNDRGERVRGRWLNSANPEMRAELARRMITRLEPGEPASLSPPDGLAFDFSPESTRLDDPSAIEPSSGRVSFSNRFVDLANDVARRVARRRPRSLLGFYAYSDYSLPPTRIDRLEPNLVPWVAPFRFSRVHRIGDPRSQSAQLLAKTIDGWSARARQFGYRTYNYNIYEAMTPFSKVSAWAHDVPYLFERRAIGMNFESFRSWDLSLPTLYLSARLMYHPQADVDALLADFYSQFYGAAGSSMASYWSEIDDGWSSLETDSGSIFSLYHVWTPERLQLLEHHLAEAASKARVDARTAARVEMARQGFLGAVDFMTIRNAFNRGDVATAKHTYDEWHARAVTAANEGIGDRYTVSYLRLFVGRFVDTAYTIVYPPDDGTQARIVAVLPDVMKLAYSTDLRSTRVPGAESPHYDDSSWLQVQTFGNTLDQQGHRDRFEVMWYRARLDVQASKSHQIIFFSRIDGRASVYVNGELVEGAFHKLDGTAVAASEFPPLTPFIVDASVSLRSGDNLIAIRVDHTTLAELALGGIVGPAFLIEVDEDA